MTHLLINCHLISPDLEMFGASIEIEGTQIRAIYPAEASLPEVDTITDIEGQMVLPGFIDMHTHGAMGADVDSGLYEEIKIVAEAKLKEGVTTLLPTTGAIPHEQLQTVAQTVARYAENPSHTKIAGLHMEGPFLNPDCSGAISPEYMRKPDATEVQAIHEILPVRIVSVAVELEGARSMIKELVEMGIAPSFAHSAATYEQFKAAKQAGVRHFTHFCNQMTGLHHREIGLVGAGLLDNGVLLEMICDRVHLCPEMIKLVFKLKPIEEIALITDSILASGMGDGPFWVHGVEREVKNGIARVIEGGALAGSTLKMNEGLRNVHQITGLPLDQLVKTTAWNQAQSLGLSGIGKIEPDYCADLVVLDNDFVPTLTLVDGRLHEF